MFQKKVPLFYLLLSTILVGSGTFLLAKYILKNKSAATVRSMVVEQMPCGYNMLRLGGYNYIRPLVTAEPECEGKEYAGLREELTNYLAEQQSGGYLSAASVYMRDFTQGDYIAINPTRRYEPGSLLKVSILITWLRMAEANPGLLNTEVVYEGIPGFAFPLEHYHSDTVVEGRKYTVKELLRHMMAYSDNRATLFLENRMDTTIFKEEFKDLGMKEPHFNESYMLSITEFSTLLKTLYNASYVSSYSSEYATELMTRSTFKDGLIKDLPVTVKVAHKFGEAGDSYTHELHESGIIFLPDNPYMLIVMTSGNDWDKQANVISHISKMVYDHMNQPKSRVVAQ